MENKFPFNHFLGTGLAERPKKHVEIDPDELPLFNFNKNSREKATNIVEHFLPTNSLTSNVPDEVNAFNSEEIQDICEEFHRSIQKKVGKEKYLAYFKGTFNIQQITLEKIIFSTSTKFIQNIINKHHKSIIQESIQEALGKAYDVEIVVKTSHQTLKTTSNSNHEYNLDKVIQESRPKTAKEASFTLELNPTRQDLMDEVNSTYIKHVKDDKPLSLLIDTGKTFDNFIVGPSNNLACATAIAIALEPGNRGRYPSVYIHSNSGLGKTHLLHAVANRVTELHPELVVCLKTARDFMKEMIESIQNNKIGDFQKRYTELIDVLMIDDIHELKNKHGTQNEFFHIFNELYNNGKQLIFTSDKSPEEIDGIEERIKSRLQWGLVVDIQRPDFETRIAILKRKANNLDLFLSDEIIAKIAHSVRSSIRELEGSLIKLSAFADVMKVEIDEEMVKDLLSLNSVNSEGVISIEKVGKVISQHYGIPLADIKSRSRNKDITHARHLAMYLTQKMISATLIEIGQFYGGRDHASVIHAIDKVREKMDKVPSLSKEILQLENKIQN